MLPFIFIKNPSNFNSLTVYQPPPTMNTSFSDLETSKSSSQDLLPPTTIVNTYQLPSNDIFGTPATRSTLTTNNNNGISYNPPVISSANYPLNVQPLATFSIDVEKDNKVKLFHINRRIDTEFKFYKAYLWFVLVLGILLEAVLIYYTIYVSTLPETAYERTTIYQDEMLDEQTLLFIFIWEIFRNLFNVIFVSYGIKALSDKDLENNRVFKIYIQVTLVLLLISLFVSFWWENVFNTPVTCALSMLVNFWILRSCNRLMLLVQERQIILDEGKSISGGVTRL